MSTRASSGPASWGHCRRRRPRRRRWRPGGRGGAWPCRPDDARVFFRERVGVEDGGGRRTKSSPPSKWPIVLPLSLRLSSLFTFCLCLSFAYCSLRTSLLAIDDVRMPREGASGRREEEGRASLASGAASAANGSELFFLPLPFLLIFFPPPEEGFFAALTISRAALLTSGAREAAEKKKKDDSRRDVAVETKCSVVEKCFLFHSSFETLVGNRANPLLLRPPAALSRAPFSSSSSATRARLEKLSS